MKVFISWSGDRSRAVAAALAGWLPHVIQVVRPFFSPDIEKGARWSSELDVALAGTSFGIVCLTSDNHTSPWLHYEAGALSKTANALVWTFLLDIDPGDVGHPLGRFQHTMTEKSDVLKLVRTINRRLADAGGEPLGEQFLVDTFENHWPRLEARLRDVAASTGPSRQAAPEGRLDRELLTEILELLRAGTRSQSPREIPQGRFGSDSQGTWGMAAPISEMALAHVEKQVGEVVELTHRTYDAEMRNRLLLEQILDVLNTVSRESRPMAYGEDSPTRAPQPESR